MIKSTMILAAIALTAVGWQWDGVLSSRSPVQRLKEERMTVEYTATSGEAVLKIAAEGEVGMSEVVVCDPRGQPLFEVRAADGRKVELQGFTLETREMTRSALFEQFMEGPYDMQARATDGQSIRGGAEFSHDLLRAPLVFYPRAGSVVPTKSLRIGWLNDPEAISYQVNLEQDDNDGLSVELPAGSNSFRVPDDLLIPGKRTQVEVGALSANGNCTLVEVVFLTR